MGIPVDGDSPNVVIFKPSQFFCIPQSLKRLSNNDIHSYTTDKRGYPHNIFFLFLNENICFGYSLEAPRRGASNEYPQHMFSLRNKKDISSFWMKNCLSVAMDTGCRLPYQACCNTFG